MTSDDAKNGFFKHAYALKTTDETKDLYAKWAQTYDQEIGSDADYRQPDRCALALAKFVADKSQPVLDIGCGTGLSGLALQSAGFTNITGCDLSPEMLAKAEKTGCYQNLFETDLNQPPIAVETSSVSAIAAVGVFSFGHVSPSAIDEFLRVLKPGGNFVIGLNDHFYEEGAFPTKLDALENVGEIIILSREHGIHLQNVEGSTGWVIVCEKKT